MKRRVEERGSGEQRVVSMLSAFVFLHEPGAQAQSGDQLRTL